MITPLFELGLFYGKEKLFCFSVGECLFCIFAYNLIHFINIFILFICIFLVFQLNLIVLKEIPVLKVQ